MSFPAKYIGSDDRKYMYTNFSAVKNHVRFLMKKVIQR